MAEATANLLVSKLASDRQIQATKSNYDFKIGENVLPGFCVKFMCSGAQQMVCFADEEDKKTFRYDIHISNMAPNGAQNARLSDADDVVLNVFMLLEIVTGDFRDDTLAKALASFIACAAEK